MQLEYTTHVNPEDVAPTRELLLSKGYDEHTDDIWVWCSIAVSVTFGQFEAYCDRRHYCSFTNGMEFEDSDLYKVMKSEALIALMANIGRTEHAISLFRRPPVSSICERTVTTNPKLKSLKYNFIDGSQIINITVTELAELYVETQDGCRHYFLDLYHLYGKLDQN